MFHSCSVKPLIVGLFLIFTFNVGTLIITLSYVKVDLLTHSGVKNNFTQLRRKSGIIIKYDYFYAHIGSFVF